MIAHRTRPAPAGPPSLVGCSAGFAMLAATAGAGGGLLLGLALGRPAAECGPPAEAGLALGALLGLSAAVLYAGPPRVRAAALAAADRLFSAALSVLFRALDLLPPYRPTVSVPARPAAGGGLPGAGGLAPVRTGAPGLRRQDRVAVTDRTPAPVGVGP